MFDYLHKFNNLPQGLKDKVSTPEIILALGELEKEFKVDLAAMVMKIMTKDIEAKHLDKYLVSEFSLTQALASKLADDLAKKIFLNVVDYLGIKKDNVSEHDSQDSEFFFSSDDEKEIEHFSNKLNDFEAKPEGDFESDLAALIKEINVNFGSQILALRFKRILHTHLKGIRDKIKTKIALKKSFEDGGLGFDDESIDRIFFSINKFIELKKLNIPSDQMLVAEGIKDRQTEAREIALRDLGARDTAYDLSALKKKSIDQLPIAPRADFDHQLIAPAEVKRLLPHVEVINEALVKSVLINKVLEKEKVLPKEDIVDVNLKEEQKVIIPQPSIRAKVISDNRKPMDDIEKAPKVMDPINELRYMDLIIFRRLASGPEKITEKIKEKILLLQSESFTNKFNGIKAWRNNFVFRLYLDIGIESLAKKESAEKVISKRIFEKRDYLTIEEFSAISKLNKFLRF